MPGDFEEFFPYKAFKPQQREVMEFVSGVIDEQAIGLVEAYCGFGKTIATFAPALAKGKKILLLTPNYAARNSATAEALRINKFNKKKIIIADLRGKQLMCQKFSKENFSHEACHKAQKYDKNCEFYKNTVEKENALTKKAEKEKQKIISEITGHPERFFLEGKTKKEPVFFQSFQETCAKNNFCPYELMKKIIECADIVILDYFWCFTGIYKILEKLINPEEFVLLVDEADLLVNRLYDDYALQLSTQALAKLLSQTKTMAQQGALQQTDTEFLEEFIKYAGLFFEINRPEQALSPEKTIDFFVSRFQIAAKKQGLKGTIDFGTIAKNLSTIVEAIKGTEELEKASARPDTFMQCLNSIRASKQYLTFINANKTKLCIKPFEINSIRLANGKTLLQTIQEFHSAILFSATIGDIELFKTELGLKETKSFKTTVMPHKKLLVLIDTELNTTYSAREKNAQKYINKISELKAIDNSLLISCCNQFETERIVSHFPEIGWAENSENLEEEKTYVLNIRTKHARSTNKARAIRNCIVIGLPLPDYSDFYFQKRKEYLEEKYGKTQASKLINRKAIDTAIQLTGRITRNLTSPKAIILADNRYKHDYYLGDFYYSIIPEYLKQYIRVVNNNSELKKEILSFWKKTKIEFVPADTLLETKNKK